MIRHSIVGKRMAVEFGEDGVNVALRLATTLYTGPEDHKELLLSYSMIYRGTIGYENIAQQLKAFVDENTEHFLKTVEKIEKAYTEVKKFADEAGIPLTDRVSDLF